MIYYMWAQARVQQLCDIDPAFPQWVWLVLSSLIPFDQPLGMGEGYDEG